MADWDALSDEVRQLSPEDQDRFIRELTEAIDEGMCSRVERLDRAASRDRDL